MFIQQAFKSLHAWWRYLLGFIIIFLASQIGTIPLIVAVLFKIISEGGDVDSLQDQAVLMGVLDSNLTLFLMLLSFAIGLLALYFVVKYFHKQPFTEVTTARKKTDWGRVLFGFLLITVTTVTLTVVDYYSNPENYIVQFNLVPFIILAVIAILMIPLQTSFEEYLFRGYLMQGLGTSTVHKKFPFVVLYSMFATLVYFVLNLSFTLDFETQFVYFLVVIGALVYLCNSNYLEGIINSGFYQKFWSVLKRNSTPLIITSVVFGALHIANPEVDKLGNIIMIYYIGTGFFLGIITLMDEGMELALGFHAGNNLISVLLVTADWTVFQSNSILKDISEPSAGFDVVAPVLIIYPIFLLIMAYRYKWNNWNEKLFGKIEAPIAVSEKSTANTTI
tara:strand:- start:201356 stop:202528 length:1173 start_codon:yes stop_codon:yes gene_type:complete